MKKQTAHRPSQSHLEYVRTRDGRQVKNTAYRPPTKTERDHTHNIVPSLGARDHSIHDPNPRIRAQLAQHGHYLDQLSHDPHDIVRYYVAQQGYDHDTLVHDPSPLVRMGVAESGYHLHDLMNDDDWGVRLEVARHGYGLDHLINDEYEDVRMEVAHQGYGHDILKDDTDEDVRGMVAYCSDDPCILSHIANTYDGDCASIATQRLHDVTHKLMES